MRIYILLVVLFATSLTGCQALAHMSSRPAEKHQEIFTKYSHLTGARYRSEFFNSFMPNESMVMTIGHNIFVNQEWWQETFDASFDWWHALMLHENEHAKRQQDMGTELWLWKYIWSKQFRWEEEFQADVARWRYLVVEKGYTISDETIRQEAQWSAQNYSGMVTEEEAYLRLNELIDQLEQERQGTTRDTSTIETQELFIPSRERNQL